MQSKRQKQIAEIIRRHFGTLLQQEGGNIYGSAVLTTVTSVKMSPDMSIAKIYISVYNTDDKQTVISQMENQHHYLKQGFVHRVRKHMRRIPELQFYLDDTLDEMYRLNKLFDKLGDDNQMGEEE